MVLIIVALCLAILAVVFALQNPEKVGISFLMWNFEGSLALILLVTFTVGFLASALLAFYTVIKKRLVIESKNEEI